MTHDLWNSFRRDVDAAEMTPTFTAEPELAFQPNPLLTMCSHCEIPQDQHRWPLTGVLHDFKSRQAAVERGVRMLISGLDPVRVLDMLNRSAQTYS